MTPTHLITLTEDGSHTLRSGLFGVTYHSEYGALEESIHVFLSAGFQYAIRLGLKNISILEIGLGTGLNCLLSCYEVMRHAEIKMHYTGVELYPINPHQVSQLNYIELLQRPELADIFEKMHGQVSDDQFVSLHPSFHLRKRKQDFKELASVEEYDIIYYDAFGPEIQPDLWDVTMMRKCYNALKDQGCLVTYCAKGSFKRALKEVGFSLDPLPGPSKKREMTRAIK